MEKDEGVDYKDPKVGRVHFVAERVIEPIHLQASPEMKALSKKFGMLHGISSLVNLWAIVALAFHGLSIANGF